MGHPAGDGRERPRDLLAATTCSTCPLLALGAAGFVSVTAHLVADRLGALIEAYLSGEVLKAQAINAGLLPVTEGIFRTQGAIMAKAALNQLGPHRRAAHCVRRWRRPPTRSAHC